MNHVTNIIRGFLMGSADIVPGVSGGTVALVLGIYERLVHNIREGAGFLGAVLRMRWDQAGERWRAIEWPFLLTLLAGIVIAVVTLAHILDTLLEDHPQAMAGLFFGLIAGSIAIAWRRVGSWTPGLVTAAAVAAVFAFAILGLRSDEVVDPSLGVFAAAAAVAIVAMILPGISGSFMLLVMGVYEPVLDAVNDRDFAVLAVLAIGATIGLAAFSTVLDRLLRDHHDPVIAILIGVMAGSLRVLWPWPDGTDTAQLAAPTDWGVPVLLAAVGAAAVLAIGRLASD